MPLFDPSKTDTLTSAVNALGTRVTALESVPTWQTLTPAAKWNTYKAIQITKRNEVVWMRGGVVEAGTNSIVLMDTVLTLPVGFRPSSSLVGLTCEQSGARGARLDLGTDGIMKIYWDTARGYPGFGGTSIYINFENVQFPLW